MGMVDLVLRDIPKSFSSGLTSSPNGGGVAICPRGSFIGAWRMGSWTNAERGLLWENATGIVGPDIRTATVIGTANHVGLVARKGDQPIVYHEQMRCPWGCRAALNDIFHFNVGEWSQIVV